jgi:preprotein translocase subunit SecB
MPTTPRRASRVPRAITADDYARFIGQIELWKIWITKARLESRTGSNWSPDVEASVSTDSAFESTNLGFRAFQHYSVKLLHELDSGTLAEIDVSFAAEFGSDIPMSDEMFAIFSDVNLPVNTWPYLREFVSSSTGRMGWEPFTLPTIKRYTEIEEEVAKPQPPAKRKSRRASPNL